MDNKNFNADQSIELIQRMIRDTRRNLSSGSSNLFILWGYLLAATAVGIFLLLTFTESRAWQWLWLPALAAGWAATWWYNRRRVSQVKSYTDRLLEQVWGCIAGLAAFSTFVICMEREWPVDPLFPVLLLISAGLFISGTVIAFVVAVEQIPGERQGDVQPPSGDDPQHPPVVGRGLPVDEGEKGADHDAGGQAADEPAREKAAFVGAGGSDFHGFFRL